MDHLNRFEEHPHLYTFLPILYVAWSDTLLTPGEMKVLREFIQSQSWLTEEDKAF